MSSVGLYCSYCGQLNDTDAVFCSRCGARQKPISDSSAAAPPTPPVAPQVPSAAPIEPSSSYAPAPTPGDIAGYPQPPAYSYAPTPAFHGYGGFWIRVVAAIIDAIVISVVAMPLRIFLMGGSMISRRSSPDLGLIFAGTFLVLGFQLVLGWIYEAGLESSTYQATLGKMALGLKVTDLYGNRISFARATGRHFAKFLSAMILFIGYIMVAFTERKQGLHDMLAGTVVLKK